MASVPLTIFDNRIEVYSPGTLPPGVSLEKMRRLEPQSVLRNPIIVGVFRDLGSRYIERLGTGVRRMALAMEEHGLPRPQFEEAGSEFRVTLMGPGERFMEEMAARPAWAAALSDRQVEAVLYVGEHERITNREYTELAGVSYNTAHHDLSDLCKRGLMEQRGRGRGQRPVIRSDGSLVRDYFYVEDGVAAYMLLAERLATQPGLGGEAFNFSNELQVTVVELVRRLLGLMGSDLEPDIRNEANNEIQHQYLSASKAHDTLGWAPLFDLQSGLQKTIAWYADHFAQQAEVK